MSWLKRLEIAANVGIVLTAVLFAIAVRHVLTSERAAQEASRPYQPGEAVDLPGLDTERSSATLVLFVRSTCPYCTESMPFYRRLLDHASKGRMRAVAVVLEQRETGAAYLAAHGLTVQNVLTIDRSRPSRVKGTPTLILLDKSGRVVNSWVGKLAGQAENEVMGAIDRVR